MTMLADIFTASAVVILFVTLAVALFGLGAFFRAKRKGLFDDEA